MERLSAGAGRGSDWLTAHFLVPTPFTVTREGQLYLCCGYVCCASDALGEPCVLEGCVQGVVTRGRVSGGL